MNSWTKHYLTFHIPVGVALFAIGIGLSVTILRYQFVISIILLSIGFIALYMFLLYLPYDKEHKQLYPDKFSRNK